MVSTEEEAVTETQTFSTPETLCARAALTAGMLQPKLSPVWTPKLINHETQTYRKPGFVPARAPRSTSWSRLGSERAVKVLFVFLS